MASIGLPNAKNAQKVLHEPFDIETHKKTFVNYLEVVIDPSGGVHYAVPSHQRWIEERLATKWHMTIEELWTQQPYVTEYLEWLCEQSRCVLVWNYTTAGKFNQKQVDTLRELADADIYFGKVPKAEREEK